MSSASLLLTLPLLGGYYFATCEHTRTYRLARATADRFYFAIAIYAVYLLALSLAFVWVSYYGSALVGLWSAGMLRCSDLPGAVGAIYAVFQDQGREPQRLVSFYQVYRVHVLVLSFGFGKVLPALWNGLIPNAKERAFLSAIEDSEFDTLLIDGLRRDIPVLFTLKSRKVYLAWVVSLPDPKREQNWIRVLPMASGYRDEKHQLRFTTDYAKILSSVMANKDATKSEEVTASTSTNSFDLDHLMLKDFEVVISKSEIDYAHMYDTAVVTRFPNGAWSDTVTSTAGTDAEYMDGRGLG